MEEIPNSDSNTLINNENNLKEEIIPYNNENEEDIKKEKNSYIKLPDNKGFKNDIYENSNIISKLFFYWGYKILKITSKYKIEASNLGTLSEKNDSKNYFNNINYYWEEKKYKTIKNYGLIKAFLSSNVNKIIIVFFLSSFE